MSDLLNSLIIPVLLAGAVYGGIRADLRHAVKGVDEAHRRIDSILMNERQG